MACERTLNVVFIVHKCGNDSLNMLNMLRLFLITFDKYFRVLLLGEFFLAFFTCTHQCFDKSKDKFLEIIF